MWSPWLPCHVGNGMRAIFRSPLQPKPLCPVLAAESGPMDGQLFLIKQLLILREQIAPFEARAEHAVLAPLAVLDDIAARTCGGYSHAGCKPAFVNHRLKCRCSQRVQPCAVASVGMNPTAYVASG